MIQRCFSMKDGEQRHHYLGISRDHWSVRFFYRQQICPDLWTSVSTDDLYSNGYRLCSTTRRCALTRLRDRFSSGFLKNKDSKLAQTFPTSAIYIIFCHRTILSPHLIYPNELELKDTTDSRKSASIVFPIVNFPFISTNIPAPPAYIIYMSQFIRYSRVCVQFYGDILQLTQILLKQSYVDVRLKQ